MTISELLERLEGVRRSGEGWKALCPAHQDTRHSLSVGVGEEEKLLVHCHAGCNEHEIAAALGIPVRDLFPKTAREESLRRGVQEIYDYTDTSGQLVFQVVRFDGKQFRQRQPIGNGHLWNLNGVTPVLYRLPAVLQAAEAGRAVWVCEGEKDCHTLERWDLVATTNAGGAGKWRTEYAADLDGAHVCILPDNDDPGRAHAEQVAASVASVARSLRIVQLPGLSAKGDVTDWVRAGGTREALLDLARETPLWEPDADPVPVVAAPEEAPRNGRRPGGAETRLMDGVTREHVRWLWPGRIPLGKLTVLDGDPGLGKALALDTPLPTPTGWTTMGEVKVGDQLLDDGGRLCNVTAVSEVMIGHPCYRLRFSDGVEIVADAEHLWWTRTRNERHREAKRRWKRAQNMTNRRNRQARPDRQDDDGEVRSTAEIAATLAVVSDNRPNHSIRNTAPIQLPDADLPIPPYTLGAWLGDGTSTCGMITCFDTEIIDQIAADGYETRDNRRAGRFSIYGLMPQLRAIGVLGNKHVPPAYLRGSEEQRRRLLAGLLDTDGYCQPCGYVEFTSTRRELAEAVLELVRSLGWTARLTEGRATLKGVVIGPRYDVGFTPDRTVFAVGRKAARQGQKRRLTCGRRYIVSCDPVASVPVRCVQVDSATRLYLASEAMIPTHNSSITLDLAARVSTGREMPDGVTSELAGSRGVVILTAEDGLGDTVRPRLEAVSADLSRISALVSVQKLSLNGEAPVSEPPDVRDLAAIEDAIREVDAALVIVDPLMAFVPDETNSSRDQGVRRILAPLSKLAEQTGAAFVVVRHLNKTSSSSPIYRGGGSIGIIGAARSGLLVAKDPDDETEARMVLAVSKANLAAPVPAISYTIQPWEDTSMIEWGAASEHTARSLLAMPERDDKRAEAVQGAREWLRDLLADGPMLTNDVRSEAKAAGMPWRVVEDAATVERIRKRKQSSDFFHSPWEWVLESRDSEQPKGNDNCTYANSGEVGSVGCDDRQEKVPAPASEQAKVDEKFTCTDVEGVGSVGRFAEMMVGDLLECARSLGVTFQLDGDRLRIEGQADVADELRDELRRRAKMIGLYLKEGGNDG